jgi:hypothetical protein
MGCLTIFGLNEGTGKKREMRYAIGTPPNIPRSAAFAEPEDRLGTILGGNRLLLNALFLAVPANQRVEDRQHVAAVFHDAEENIAQFGLAFGVTVPFR